MNITPYLKTIFTSRFSLVFILFMLSFAIFFVTRLVLIFINQDQALNTPFLLPQLMGIGAVFDIAFFAYASIPLALYLLFSPNGFWTSSVNKYIVNTGCFLTIYFLLLVAVSELLFWQEFQARFNFISVDYLIYRQEVSDNIIESYPTISILVILLLFTILIYWKIFAYINKSLTVVDPIKKRLIISAMYICLPLAATIVQSDWTNHSKNNFLNELSGNGPYQFFAAFRNNELDYEQFYATLDTKLASNILRNEVKEENSIFSREELFDIRRTIHQVKDRDNKLNVMLVMIESLSAEFLGVYGNKENLTPVLDRISNESLSFQRMYATGTRTTRGLEAVTLSIPPTPGRSIVKRLGRESNMWSLGNIVKNEGYKTLFLYGGRGYFDNMNAFFSGNGYEVVDRTNADDKNVGFENAWGMADEYLYEMALKEADTAYSNSEPFLFHIMTTSNHRPYTYPSKRIDIPSGTGRNGAVKYSDWAIGDFLERAQTKAWFNNTLFVFLADHTASSAGKSALTVNKYHIPMFIYSPMNIIPKAIAKISSQIDVAPTILALLGIEYSSNFFGKNILTMGPDSERALIGNYQHLGFYTEGQLSIISPKKLLTQYINPENSNPTILDVDSNNPMVRRALSFYQGASYIYRYGLNTWDSTSGSKSEKLTYATEPYRIR